MSVRKIVGKNIEESKSELEATSEMKLGEIKSGNVKITESLDMKI